MRTVRQNSLTPLKSARREAVGQRTNVSFFRQVDRLLGSQAREGEHANLLLDVSPIARRLSLNKAVVKLVPHLNDTVRHALDLSQPLGVERLVAEDGAGDPGAVNRRVRVERSNNDLELRIDSGLLLNRLGNDRKGTDSLAVETHVLREMTTAQYDATDSIETRVRRKR